MKKAVCIFLIFCCLFSSANAEIIGAGYATDISAYIDGVWIPSYNIDGYTAVLVRDLESYGFEVIWEAETETVRFYRDFAKPSSPIIPAVELRPVGTKVFDVYKTNIRTFFKDKEIPSYNIGGKTAVRLRDIALLGEAQYDEKYRSANIFCREIELFDSEIEYIKGVFYPDMMLLSRADMALSPVVDMLSKGVYDFESVQTYKSFFEEFTMTMDTLKTYKEPYGFDKSVQELWWAMVNMRLAGEKALSMCDMLKNGKDFSSLMGEYEQYRIDSLEQRRIALKILDEEIQILAFFWE